jgi:hypothetical protein
LLGCEQTFPTGLLKKTQGTMVAAGYWIESMVYLFFGLSFAVTSGLSIYARRFNQIPVIPHNNDGSLKSSGNHQSIRSGQRSFTHNICL